MKIKRTGQSLVETINDASAKTMLTVGFTQGARAQHSQVSEARSIRTFRFPPAESQPASLAGHSPQFESTIQVITRDGQPWFIAREVAQVLGYRDAEGMTRNLDDDEKGTQIVCTPGGDQAVLIVNESGLYAAIFKSRKSEATRFKKWVTSQVLPSIRQHGGYSVGQERLPAAMVAGIHKTITENAIPALHYYDKLTEHDHWATPAKRHASHEWAIREAALKYDLPVSLMVKLTNQGISAISA